MMLVPRDPTVEYERIEERGTLFKENRVGRMMSHQLALNHKEYNTRSGASKPI